MTCKCMHQAVIALKYSVLTLSSNGESMFIRFWPIYILWRSGNFLKLARSVRAVTHLLYHHIAGNRQLTASPLGRRRRWNLCWAPH